MRRCMLHPFLRMLLSVPRLPLSPPGRPSFARWCLPASRGTCCSSTSPGTGEAQLAACAAAGFLACNKAWCTHTAQPGLGAAFLAGTCHRGMCDATAAVPAEPAARTALPSSSAPHCRRRLTVHCPTLPCCSTQVPDDGESDGFDEAICPTDMNVRRCLVFGSRRQYDQNPSCNFAADERPLCTGPCGPPSLLSCLPVVLGGVPGPCTCTRLAA